MELQCTPEIIPLIHNAIGKPNGTSKSVPVIHIISLIRLPIVEV